MYAFTVQMFLIQNQPDCSGASGKHNIHYLMASNNVIRMWSIQLSKCKEPQCEAPWLGQIWWNWAFLMLHLITVINYHCWEPAHANSCEHSYVQSNVNFAVLTSEVDSAGSFMGRHWNYYSHKYGEVIFACWK